MCGIVGYIGSRNAVEVLTGGLRSLEYRGYDSAGISLLGESGEFTTVKGVGKVSDLEKLLAGMPPLAANQGIGHTRWATHGGVTEVNAHPHSDLSSRIVLVHNGIVENYREIREELSAAGHGAYKSETDSEVIAVLLASLYKDDMVQALKELHARLRGSFALAIMTKDAPGVIYCLRKGSPLVVGITKNGEAFCASDIPAVLPYTQDVIYLNDGDIAELTKDGVRFWDEKGAPREKKISHIDWDVSMVDKGGYPHFMLKEINEQGAVLRNSLAKRAERGTVSLAAELPWTEQDIRKWRNIHIVACGTSYYAGLVAERIFENLTDFDIRADVASEYRYRKISIDSGTLAIFISQSGETADTLAAERVAKAQGARCLAITNVMGSTLAREVDHVLQLKAGPEIGVAATKTFIGQLAVLYILALYMAKLQGRLSPDREAAYVEELSTLPYKVETVLQKQEQLQKMASQFSDARDFLILGRGFSFPIAREGALKLKETSYVHAEAFPAGELKHGPIALLDPKIPVVAIAPKDSLYEKNFSNILEVKARNAPVIVIATEGDRSMDDAVDNVITVPATFDDLTPFLTVVPLQLFAYFFARTRGCNIDQPRNLAKSVTVE